MVYHTSVQWMIVVYLWVNAAIEGWKADEDLRLHGQHDKS